MREVRPEPRQRFCQRLGITPAQLERLLNGEAGDLAPWLAREVAAWVEAGGRL